MKLNDLADELLEIRRYVRTHPDHVKEHIGPLIDDVRRINTFFERTRGLRLAENLHVGLASFACNEAGQCVTVVDPEIIEGYLYGAAQEIRALAMREEAAVEPDRQ